MNSTPGEYSNVNQYVIAGFRKNHFCLFLIWQKMWGKIHSVAVKEEIVVSILFQTFCISL